ncbi:MAG: SMP-30/gluconolactonase/LRE family protein [Marinoscillum sp.]
MNHLNIYCIFLLSLIIACGPKKAAEVENTSPVIADDAELQQVSDQFKFTEGPASDKAGNVYFTDQPNDKIWKWAPNGELTVFMDSTGRSNGLYIDHSGKLLACADLDNELWKINMEDKSYEVMLKGFEDEKYNGPNDMWLDAKGGIYFTDPFYKRWYWADTSQQQSNCKVFYLPAGAEQPIVLDTTLIRPNGIIGTPDQSKLYVADNTGKKIFVYQIDSAGALSNKKLFADMGSDGMTVDNEGNIYVTGDGVTVFDSTGVQIEHIPVNESWTANVTFGGPDQDILFITAMKSVYTLKMKVKGVRW